MFSKWLVKYTLLLFVLTCGITVKPSASLSMSCVELLQTLKPLDQVLFDYASILKPGFGLAELNTVLGEKEGADLLNTFRNKTGVTEKIGLLLRLQQYFREYERHSRSKKHVKIEQALLSFSTDLLKGSTPLRLMYLWTTSAQNDSKIDIHESTKLVIELVDISLSDFAVEDLEFLIEELFVVYENAYKRDRELAYNLFNLLGVYLESSDKYTIMFTNTFFEKIGHRFGVLSLWLKHLPPNQVIAQFSLAALLDQLPAENLGVAMGIMERRGHSFELIEIDDLEEGAAFSEEKAEVFLDVLKTPMLLKLSKKISLPRLLSSSSYFTSITDQKRVYDSLVRYLGAWRLKLTWRDIAASLKLVADQIQTRSSDVIVLYGHVKEHLSGLVTTRRENPRSSFAYNQKSRMKVYSSSFYIQVLALMDAVDWESLRMNVVKFTDLRVQIEKEYHREEVLLEMIHERLQEFGPYQLRVLAFHYELIELEKAGRGVSDVLTPSDVKALAHNSSFFHVYAALHLLHEEKRDSLHQYSRSLFGVRQVLQDQVEKRHLDLYTSSRKESPDQDLMHQVYQFSAQLDAAIERGNLLFLFLKAQRFYERTILRSVIWGEDFESVERENREIIKVMKAVLDKLVAAYEQENESLLMDESTRLKFEVLLLELRLKFYRLAI